MNEDEYTLPLTGALGRSQGTATTDVPLKGQKFKIQREYKIEILAKYCGIPLEYIAISTFVLKCNYQVIGDARQAVNFGLHEAILFKALTKVIFNLNSSETKSKLVRTL